MNPRGRLPGIDVVRALAAGLVMLQHGIYAVTIWRPGWLAAHSGTGTVEMALCEILGAWGVGLFFLLSGLCIHLPQARRGTQELDLRRYYARRFRRIYPPHFVALLLSMAAALLIPAAFFDEPKPVSWPSAFQFVTHVLTLHSYFPSARYSINNVFWTIGIEMHFYLCYPLLLRLRRRVGFGTIAAGLFALSIGSKLLLKALAPGYAELWALNLPGRYWEWALGCLVAERLAAQDRPSRWPEVAALLFGTYALGAVLALLGLRFPGLHSGAIITRIWPPLFAWTLLRAAQLAPEGRATELLGHAGLRSYSLYLVHPIGIGLAVYWLSLASAPPLVQLAGGLAAGWLLHLGFFRLVEQRFMNPGLRPNRSS